MTSSSDNYLNERLAIALEKRDKNLARKLCAKGADPNCNLGWGFGQFLRKAIETTDIEGIQFLIELGADPNKVEDPICILTRVVNAWLSQCHSYIEKYRAIYFQFRGGEITQRQCTYRQHMLKKDYEKNEFPIIKLKVAKLLVDAGADINGLCHPLRSSIENGLKEFRITIFFILYCNIDWDRVYADCFKYDLKKTIDLWRKIAEVVKASEQNSRFIAENDIDLLVNLPKEQIVDIAKELAWAHFNYIEDHEESYNSVILRKNYSDLETIGNAYALDISEQKDKDNKIVLFLIEPEEFEDKLGKFWIEKGDLVYLCIGAVRLSYEVIEFADFNDSTSTYANQYVCKLREDMICILE